MSTKQYPPDARCKRCHRLLEEHATAYSDSGATHWICPTAEGYAALEVVS